MIKSSSGPIFAAIKWKTLNIARGARYLEGLGIGCCIVDIAAMILVIMAICAGLLEFCGHLSTISSGWNFERDQSGRDGCPQSESGCLPVGVVEYSSCSGCCPKLNQRIGASSGLWAGGVMKILRIW